MQGEGGGIQIWKVKTEFLPTLNLYCLNCLQGIHSAGVNTIKLNLSSSVYEFSSIMQDILKVGCN